MAPPEPPAAVDPQAAAPPARPHPDPGRPPGRRRGAPRRADHPARTAPHGRALAALALGALGVVYGDIGTSPLYALKECFTGQHGVEPTPAERARRPLAGLLGHDLRGHLQVPLLRHARRQPRRGRHPRAAGAGLAQGPQPARPQGAAAARHLRRRAALRRRHHHPGHLGALGGGGRGGGGPGARPGWWCRSPCCILAGLFLIQRSGTARVGRHLRPDHAGLVRRHRGARRPRHPARPVGAGGGQPAPRRALLRPRTAAPASWCWARWSSASPAARRSTPTWATSASAPSGWPGSGWPCRR